MFLDIALVFDPGTRRCDIAIGPDGDLLLDRTAATPLIVSLGSDARAQGGDVLPDIWDPATPIFNVRRGTALDALDRQGRRRGSRLWLISRAKQTEDTRLSAVDYAQQATQWIEDDRGVPVAADASWLRRGVLSLVVQAGVVSVAVPIQVT